jgi:hypothetical protein
VSRWRSGRLGGVTMADMVVINGGFAARAP